MFSYATGAIKSKPSSNPVLQYPDKIEGACDPPMEIAF